MTARGWITLAPRFETGRRAHAVLASAARVIARKLPDEAPAAAHDLVEDRAGWPHKDQARLVAAILVLGDLRAQASELRVRAGVIAMRPSGAETERDAEKQRIRRQELVKRDEQLASPSVRAFVHSMERRRLHRGRFTSIFSLMRDGRDLAASLEELRGTGAEGEVRLREVIDPYVQVVAAGTACEETGLDLMEIWRYFRHTWTNQYASVPGRSMPLLVRDRAAPMHPVIGIAALGSPVVQIRERDWWIGWHPTRFVEEASAAPTDELAQWLVGVVDTAISELHVSDLLEEDVVTKAEIRKPSSDAVARLEAFSRRERELHHALARAGARKPTAKDWLAGARSPLYRSKRAGMFAELLDARKTLLTHLGRAPSAAGLSRLLRSPEGDRVVRRIVRKAKSDRVGIAMADITVCGAVQPYNAILGGKLVAMLMASPEVVRAYHDRYASAESEIASSMAGRAIVREPTLVFLGTTSLYGAGSSQYNRIKIPCERVGGRAGDEIRYAEIGRSEAFGTSQFSEEALEALHRVLAESGEGRVNYIFGEGVNPKLRRVRHALELLDLPTEDLLRHGRERIVYGVSLVANLKRYLLGLDREPSYLVPVHRGERASVEIAAWWRTRWLRNRIESAEVLAEVRRHTLVHPITHGARVVPPRANVTQHEFDFTSAPNRGD